MATTKNRGFDWVTLGLYISLLAIGWLILFSASHSDQSEFTVFNFSSPIGKQTLWLGVSLIVFFAALIIDWKFWNSFAYPIYVFSVILLVMVLIFGSEIKGAKSWFAFAGFSLQPSEFAKFGAALGISAYLSFFKTTLSRLRPIVVASGIILLPAFLILLQPDAGSAMVFGSFLILFFRNGLSPIFYLVLFLLFAVIILSLIFDPWLVLLLVIIGTIIIYGQYFSNRIIVILSNILIPVTIIGLNYFGFVNAALIVGGASVLVLTAIQFLERRQRFAMLTSAMVILGISLSFGSKWFFEEVLKPHQQDRINVWLRPDKCDPRGSLYNLLQSKTAIGSGGLQGKGFLKGTMKQLNYVPEQTTDFIFSIIGEEQGFVGALSLISLFCLLLIRITFIAERAKTKFIRNFAYSVAGIIFVHFFVNIGMSMGVMPVIGIPLIFLSKGGSSLLVFSLMMGVLLKMDVSRFSR